MAYTNYFNLLYLLYPELTKNYVVHWMISNCWHSRAAPKANHIHCVRSATIMLHSKECPAILVAIHALIQHAQIRWPCSVYRIVTNAIVVSLCWIARRHQRNTNWAAMCAMLLSIYSKELPRFRLLEVCLIGFVDFNHALIWWYRIFSR